VRNRHVGGLKFRRQQQLGDYVVDFFCAEAKLAVEVDGDIHDLRKELDEARTLWLEEGGIHVVRFRNEQVLKDIGAVLGQIVRICEERVGKTP
jgi:very-short-patch-repair endonuclease